MSIARLSPSFAVSEAALHQHPSHILLLSPLLMILHKCSDQLLGQFLCSSNACPLLNCTGMVFLPPARFALWQPACLSESGGGQLDAIWTWPGSTEDATLCNSPIPPLSQAQGAGEFPDCSCQTRVCSY